jgi:hypothetical protein
VSHLRRRRGFGLAKLRIPKEQIKALGEIFKLTQTQFKALVAALAAVPLSVDTDDFEKAVGPKIQSLSKSPDALLKAIVALNVTRAHSEPPLPEFVANAVESLSEELPATDGEAIAKQRLTELLEIDSLMVATKGIHLNIDRERIFQHARVLTDARPIFGPQVTAAPAAMLITQTLKISCFQDDRMIDLYIALDEDDISELQEVLTRAKTKATTLKNLLTSANMKVVSA